jgi:hypothetical protein
LFISLFDTDMFNKMNSFFGNDWYIEHNNKIW